ncbi:hypothetical protein [Bradyrhizobium sp. SZCCHNRI1009]|uniref:hypothetical protein n=1 Tax=Bradyrhizobium sp. SZCCHNRI1009 TaxID=3057277 RepID=UPI0029169168|nr:hypothetical protein [Bradyrhizobium sp. SZCCHNRI1009]
MKRIISACIGVLFFTTPFHSANAQVDMSQCNAALVKSTYNKSTSVASDWRMSSLVTKEAFDDLKASGGLTAVLYGVPVKGDYNAYKQDSEKLRQEHKESLTYNQQVNLAWTGLDPNGANAYIECIKNIGANVSGLQMYVQYATEESVVVHIKWYLPNVNTATIDWSIDDPALQAVVARFPKTVSQGELIETLPRTQASAAVLQANATAPNGATYPAFIHFARVPPIPQPFPEPTVCGNEVTWKFNVHETDPSSLTLVDGPTERDVFVQWTAGAPNSGNISRFQIKSISADGSVAVRNLTPGDKARVKGKNVAIVAQKSSIGDSQYTAIGCYRVLDPQARIWRLGEPAFKPL